MRLITLLTFPLLFLTGCSHNPVTGKKELHLISESQEISLGEQHYLVMQQAQGGEYLPDDGALACYVQDVGDKLARVSDRPSLPYQFVVLDNSIPNAWALPGGKIAINRGLLLELHSEAELAAVLAHEIVHSAARHGAQGMERGILMQLGLLGFSQVLKDHKYENIAVGAAAVGTGLVALKYSRNAEFEADHYGIKYMVAAGYDPQAAVELQRIFLSLSKEKESNWFVGLFATHPPSLERLKANEETAASYPPGGVVGKEPYEKAIAHLKKTEKAFEDLDKGYEALLRSNAQKALSLAKSGIAIEPREAHLYNLKGKAEERLGMYKEASASFNEAIKLNPHYFDFYLQRGLLEGRLGQESLARLDLEKSLTYLPSAEAHTALGMLDLNEGYRQSAIAHFRIASQADSPAGAQARSVLERLDLRQ
jgi:beta-barrel assembly-enhancing protease